uniref:Uncharacterized protein n=1 Tax=Rhizophora mucronata TaxID=61149 RepID=A0A2P2J644_RHIMU
MQRRVMIFLVFITNQSKFNDLGSLAKKIRFLARNKELLNSVYFFGCNTYGGGIDGAVQERDLRITYYYEPCQRHVFT